MPSAALRLRADGDGDGRADIWRSQPDALRLDRQLSARRRLEAELPWGVPVRVPAGLNRAAVRNPLRRRAARGSTRATAAG